MENSSPQKLISLNTFLKWGLIGFIGAILVIAIVLSTNLDEAKKTLIAKVSAETGIKIDIESIGFGFAHGLGLKCSGVNIVTPDGETYAVEQLHLLAQWGPLFAGEFKIESAALDSPKLTLRLPDPTEKKTGVR